MDEPRKSTKFKRESLLEVKPWHTIESAASIIVLDDVIKGEKWCDNARIQETYKRLRDKAVKAFRYSELKISVLEATELIINNPYLAEAMRAYPELYREDLVTAVENYFGREIAVSRTALGDIIKSENWIDIFEIQELPAKEMLSRTCKSLFEDVCKACKDSESIIKKDKITELIKKNF